MIELQLGKISLHELMMISPNFFKVSNEKLRIWKPLAKKQQTFASK